MEAEWARLVEEEHGLTDYEVYLKKTDKQVLLIVWTWCKRRGIRGDIRVDEI